jgi:hypothetical protein
MLRPSATVCRLRLRALAIGLALVAIPLRAQAMSVPHSLIPESITLSARGSMGLCSKSLCST